jgi:carboxynorspermidine decarboxylase
MKLPLDQITTPCYVCDEDRLESNLKILRSVKEQTGCKIILALKAFSMYALFPLIKQYLSGTAASSLYEAKLGHEEFNKDVHVYSPAYSRDEIDEICSYASHITFNSLSQWHQFKPLVKKDMSCGIRLNPEYSEVKTPLYDPCQQYSRFGITKKELSDQSLEGISYLHFHTLCGLGVDSLERTLHVLEDKFGAILDLEKIKWVNFGGGHHITQKNYDTKKLCSLITSFQDKHQVTVILEPGEGIVLNAGYLVTSVLDIMRNEKEIAILDTSATAHMPDVLEMPYRPDLIEAGEANQYSYTYKLAGVTCLSGDVIGEYSFKKPLAIGDKLVFEDMAQYTMVKNTMFNGIPLPAIASYTKKNGLQIYKTFGYDTFKNRLS